MVAFDLSAIEVRRWNPFDTSGDSTSEDRQPVHPLCSENTIYAASLVPAKLLMTASAHVCNDMPRLLGANMVACSTWLLMSGCAMNRYSPEQTRRGRWLEPNRLATALDAMVLWNFLGNFLTAVLGPGSGSAPAPALHLSFWPFLTPIVSLLSYFGCRERPFAACRFTRGALPSDSDASFQEHSSGEGDIDPLLGGEPAAGA